MEGLDGVALVEKVATKRAWRMKGGALDIEKAALAFLKDYRTGVLGAISLETPESRAQMMATPVEPPASDAVEESGGVNTLPCVAGAGRVAWGAKGKT